MGTKYLGRHVGLILQTLALKVPPLAWLCGFVMHTKIKRWAGYALVLLLPGLTSCSTLSYYLQSMHGHFSMLHVAKPIDEWLQDPATSQRLRQQLARVQQIRLYAERELHLPNNRSYTTYADLQRPFVVWNVFSTPELSLQLTEWCFVVVGCVNYRGYYEERQAQQYAEQQRRQGLDALVMGVPAYSTLGWFDDPVLNTFVMLPEPELARMIFHELAHQVVFVKGDTVFNESFATAVELAGVEQWLKTQPDSAMRQRYEEYRARQHDFLHLLQQAKWALTSVYSATDSVDIKRHAKEQIFSHLRTEYERVKREQWGGFSGYDRFFAQPLNNAHLAAVGVYTERVPAFLALLKQQGDWPSFFARVQQIAALPQDQRAQALIAAETK